MSHGHGVETDYGHLQKFMPGLKQGSVVHRGDIIGFVGSTGPHLHFEVLADGRQMDPLQLTVAFASDRLLSLR
jgi:murein DD-endopeptidase MepM/ murein hydrolase activator NlpD